MEEFVTIEISKLLEELEFDGYCMAYYRGGDGTLLLAKERVDKTWIEEHSSKNHSKYYLAPTQQMVKRWLKEVHEIFIGENYVNYESGNHSYFIVAKNMKNNAIIEYRSFDNLEFGINRVIFYILKLIKDKN